MFSGLNIFRALSSRSLQAILYSQSFLHFLHICREYLQGALIRLLTIQITSLLALHLRTCHGETFNHSEENLIFEKSIFDRLIHSRSREISPISVIISEIFFRCSRLAMCSVDPMQSVLYGGPRSGITPSYHQLGLQLALAGLSAPSADHISTQSTDKMLADQRMCISNESNGKYP